MRDDRIFIDTDRELGEISGGSGGSSSLIVQVSHLCQVVCMEADPKLTQKTLYSTEVCWFGITKTQQTLA